MTCKADGRRNMAPMNVPEGTKPIKIRVGVANRVCEEFERNGVSYHSSAGGLVWLIVTYCKANKYAYEVVCDPEYGGWSVKKL